MWTRALREIVERDEFDRAFRRYGPALADIDRIFPDDVTAVPPHFA